MQDASGNTTQFKIKTATALKKLMSTYCERNGLDVQVSMVIVERLKNIFIHRMFLKGYKVIARVNIVDKIGKSRLYIKL